MSLKILLDLFIKCQTICLIHRPVRLLLTDDKGIDNLKVLSNSTSELLKIDNDLKRLKTIQVMLSNRMLEENYADCETVDIINDEKSEEFYLFAVHSLT
jgi:hypothetical protein